MFILEGLPYYQNEQSSSIVSWLLFFWSTWKNYREYFVNLFIKLLYVYICKIRDKPSHIGPLSIEQESETAIQIVNKKALESPKQP